MTTPKLQPYFKDTGKLNFDRNPDHKIKLTSIDMKALTLPESSDWECYLFGSSKGNGITYIPIKGNEPNFFWRWMQFLCFGNRWTKVN